MHVSNIERCNGTDEIKIFFLSLISKFTLTQHGLKEKELTHDVR